jgi:hypothetical protein
VGESEPSKNYQTLAILLQKVTLSDELLLGSSAEQVPKGMSRGVKNRVFILRKVPK